MLLPMFSSEEKIKVFLEKYYLNLGVEIITYPIDEDGYSHLSNVLQNWSKQLGPIARPLGFLEKIKLIDEVL